MTDQAATPATAPAPDASDVTRAEHILSVLDAEEKASEGKDAVTEATAAPEPAKGDAQKTEETQETQETTETEPGEQEPEHPRTYKVKVNGLEVEATLDELLKGYSRTEDYKAKTASAAEQRRLAEAERVAVAAERRQYAERLRGLAEIAPQLDPIIAEGQKLDWVKLANEDPATYTAKRAQYEERVWQIRQIQAEKQRTDAEEATQKARAELGKLIEKLPEWSDETKAKEGFASLTKELADGYGFNEDDVGAISDHRLVLIARDAIAYRKLMADKKAAEAKKVADAPKVQKPGATTEAKRDADSRIKSLKQQARKTGRTDDTVAAVMAALE